MEMKIEMILFIVVLYSKNLHFLLVVYLYLLINQSNKLKNNTILIFVPYYNINIYIYILLFLLYIMSQKKKSSKSKNSSNSIIFIVICLIICCIGYYFITHRGNQQIDLENNIHEASIDKMKMKEYKDVINKAKDLTDRYNKLMNNNNNNAIVKTNIDKPSSISNNINTNPTNSLQINNKYNNNKDNNNIITNNLRSVNQRNLILGIAQNTDPKNYAVFCKSLRKVSNNDETEVIIFINSPVPNLLRDLSIKNNIKVIEYDLNSLSPIIQKFHPSTLRWPLFLNLLKDPQIRLQYSRIWMIDVRDSYFQSDPFQMLPINTQAFYAFNGVEGLPIGQCGWNGGWVKDCFGESSLSEIKDKQIICSGVSMGDTESVYKYLIIMEDVIMGKKQTIAGKKSKFPTCERNGVDQGTHNYILHKGYVSNLHIWSQFDGPVMNMQAKKATIKSDIVYNSRGEKSAIVHQYDRFPALQKALFKQYVDWTDTDNPMAEWKEDQKCNSFNYKENVDMFKGRCDLKLQGGATSAASCCNYCLNVPGCKAFTFLSGTCFMKSCNSINAKNEIKMSGALSGYLK
jgi:hypothetical protein